MSSSESDHEEKPESDYAEIRRINRNLSDDDENFESPEDIIDIFQVHGDHMPDGPDEFQNNEWPAHMISSSNRHNGMY